MQSKWNEVKTLVPQRDQTLQEDITQNKLAPTVRGAPALRGEVHTANYYTLPQSLGEGGSKTFSHTGRFGGL